MRFEPTFPDGGYVMSHVTQTVLNGRLIRLITEDGQSGVGEIVRKPIYDPEELTVLEDACLPALQDMLFDDLPLLLDQWRQDIKLMGLAFGVETAMYDLIGKASGVPVSTLLGGPGVGDVSEYFSISCETPDKMAKMTKEEGGGFSVVQAKLGIGGIAIDLERIEAVLNVMKPYQLLLADFNGALKPDLVIETLQGIRDPRLMWEEPCYTLEENIEVAHELKQPVMFDQCMNGIPAYLRAIDDAAAAALVIKPAFLGGLSVARTVRDICIAADMKIRIDGPWSGQIAASAALHLALGAPEEMMISSANLVGPINTARDMIIVTEPGRVMPASGPGLGPVPSDLFDGQK